MIPCAICGRPLTNPASIAAGVGPICAGRSYVSRIYQRFGAQSGWGGIQEWAKVNNPCFKCKHFKFPDAKQEKRVSVKEYEVSMDGNTQRLSATSIGGCCTKHNRLVDGNTINSDTSCLGIDHESRPDNAAAVGLLSTSKGMLRLDFETGLSQLGLEKTSDN